MTMTLLYVPLDERPCNLAYPLRLFEGRPDLTVLTPPSDLLGLKKRPADVPGLRAFIRAHIAEADAVVYSTEMVVYGGLLPSRIYPVSADQPDVAGYVAFIESLRQTHPGVKLYASNLIMRTPRYSSGDEEPDYYEHYGAAIFRHGWLRDKADREGLDEAETAELTSVTAEIPAADLADYEARRAANLKVNLANIALVKSGVLDTLVIPQDDSAPYGYTARDQAVVYPAIKRERLQGRIATYPGADEAGYTLLARAVQALSGRTVKVYPFFASTVGATSVPLYEDRPLSESLRSHILATGAVEVATPQEADLLLAVNTPGQQMMEARDQLAKPDITYDTFRNLRAFVNTIRYYLEQGRPVAVADSAYANGSDLELISMLDAQGLLSQLAAYRGWNTNCNTLGSTIAAAIIQAPATPAARRQELLAALLDDGFYQAIVRGETTANWLPAQGLTYFDLKDQADTVATQVEGELDRLAAAYLPQTLAGHTLHAHVTFPWNRMFEINCSYNAMEV